MRPRPHRFRDEAPNLNPRGISVIVASVGQPTLERCLAGIGPQLAAGDELLVDVNADAPWGHRARNRMMHAARFTNMLAFYDDDDYVMPDALATIRTYALTAPDDWHIFRMGYGATTLWREKSLHPGNVSTQMVVVPWRLATAVGVRWSDRYEGDFDFMASVRRTSRQEPIWHEEIVAIHNGLAKGQFTTQTEMEML